MNRRDFLRRLGIGLGGVAIGSKLPTPDAEVFAVEGEWIEGTLEEAAFEPLPPFITHYVGGTGLILDNRLFFSHVTASVPLPSDWDIVDGTVVHRRDDL